MGDGSDMRVDLSALDDVISKLRKLTDGMGSAKEKAKYQTEVPKKAFGKMDTFEEARELAGAYEKCKSDLERAIQGMEDLVEKFGTGTSKAKDRYHEQEYANKNQMGGGSGKWD